MAENPTQSKLLLQGVRALVLDDEETICHVIRSALAAHGATAAIATGGEAALQQLLKDDFDLVTVDLRMPRFNGLAFMREARKIWPWLGFVVVTGAPQDDLIRQARALGVTRILRKPFKSDELVAMIRAEADECRERLLAQPAPSPEQLQQYHRILRRIAETALAAHTIVDAMIEFQRGFDMVHSVDIMATFALENDRGLFVARAGAPTSESVLENLAREAQTLFEALSGRSFGAIQPRLVLEGEAVEPSPEGNTKKMASVIMLPILEGAKLDGLLVLASRADNLPKTIDLSFMLAAANTMSAVMAGLARARHLATHDFLTGIGNRAFFEETLKHELALSRRTGRPLALLLMDLDSFKEINDSFGHATGDKALRDFAKLLIAETRAADTAVRYGGDEFAVLLPETDVEDALILGRRLVQKAERHVFEHEHSTFRLTLSAGVAGSWDLDSTAPPSLMTYLADIALYRAKRAGRNTACAWTRDQPLSQSAIDANSASSRSDTDPAALMAICDMALALLDARENRYALHCYRVRAAALILGRAMGLEPRILTDLEWAALLHDIGKIGVPEHILLKKGPLSREERRIIENHAALGAKIAATNPAFYVASTIIGAHHERFDGAGYPRGLKGDEIPIAARVLALADAYAALRTDRSYRPAMTRAQAERHVREGEARHFDPEAIKAFMGCVNEIEATARFDED